MNMHLSAEQRTIASQRVRIEELEEELRQTKESLAPMFRFPPRWNLTVAQQRMLSAFCKNGALSREQLLTVMESKARTREVVDVQISLLRRKLESLGVKIINIYGVGYEITPDSKAFIKSVLAGGKE